MNLKGGFQPGDPRAVSAGKRAGIVSGEIRRQHREQRWKDQGIDPILATAIRQSGYNSGWAQGWKAGQRKALKAFTRSDHPSPIDALTHAPTGN